MDPETPDAATDREHYARLFTEEIARLEYLSAWQSAEEGCAPCMGWLGCGWVPWAWSPCSYFCGANQYTADDIHEQLAMSRRRAAEYLAKHEMCT